MGLIETLLIAVGLAMDAFAVSLGIGAGGRANSAGAKFRLAGGFGFFQFMMPVIGWFAGMSVANFIDGFDHWIAFILLAFVGGKMVREGFDPNGEKDMGDPSRGRTWLMLCVATSIDALAIGLGFAMLRVEIWQPSIIIGVITAGISLGGLLLGAKAGEVFGKKAEILGGLVLIGIGLRVLISHLLS